MEIVHVRCAGLDISKRDAKVCVRVGGAGRRKTVETVTTWGSTTNQVLALRDHLIAEQVRCAVMEATGDYWKPFYYLLEDAGFEVLLVNARHVKNLPGRKTDVSDATWLAQLGAHGLVRGSFVPPEPIRALRDLTRARTAITRERGREIQRLEKLLEDAGIKLSSVASDITGVSGRAMLHALVAGQRDPAALADLARRRLRSKIAQLTEALTGRFTDHHAFLARVHLDLIDRHTAAIDEITARIEQVIEPFHGFRDLICTIPEATSQPAGSSRPRPAPATPTCKEPSGPPRWPAPKTPEPTSAPDIGGSRRAADRRRPTSRSSTRCSPPSGTWAPPAPSTTTQAATSSPDCTPNARGTEPSTSSTPWATTSPSTAPANPGPPAGRVNLRVSEL